MICPWDNCGCEWSDTQGYLGQSFHYGLTFREVGRRCPECGLTFVIEQKCIARPWHKRPQRPPDKTIDMFEEDKPNA
jgi:hypothetical protein